MPDNLNNRRKLAYSLMRSRAYRAAAAEFYSVAHMAEDAGRDDIADECVILAERCEERYWDRKTIGGKYASQP